MPSRRNITAQRRSDRNRSTESLTARTFREYQEAMLQNAARNIGEQVYLSGLSGVIDPAPEPQPDRNPTPTRLKQLLYAGPRQPRNPFKLYRKEVQLPRRRNSYYDISGYYSIIFLGNRVICIIEDTVVRIPADLEPEYKRVIEGLVDKIHLKLWEYEPTDEDRELLIPANCMPSTHPNWRLPSEPMLDNSVDQDVADVAFANQQYFGRSTYSFASGLFDPVVDEGDTNDEVLF